MPIFGAASHNWIKLVRRTGLKGIRLHDARHTHASLMLKQGVHPKVVQERLGHASIQITLDTYSHVVPRLHTVIIYMSEMYNIQPECEPLHFSSECAVVAIHNSGGTIVTLS